MKSRDLRSEHEEIVLPFPSLVCQQTTLTLQPDSQSSRLWLSGDRTSISCYSQDDGTTRQAEKSLQASRRKHQHVSINSIQGFVQNGIWLKDELIVCCLCFRASGVAAAGAAVAFYFYSKKLPFCGVAGNPGNGASASEHFEGTYQAPATWMEALYFFAEALR